MRNILAQAVTLRRWRRYPEYPKWTSTASLMVLSCQTNDWGDTLVQRLHRLLRRVSALLRGKPYLPPHLSVGEAAWIAPTAYIDWNHAAHVTIEDHVVLAPHSAVLAHDASSAMSTGLMWVAPIHLKRYCYIGYRAIVLPGVTVGEHAIVGAGAVVSRDVPDGAVVAGVPARQIGIVADLEQHRLSLAAEQGVFPTDLFTRTPIDEERLRILREAAQAGGYFTGGIPLATEYRRYPLEDVETV